MSNTSETTPIGKEDARNLISGIDSLIEDGDDTGESLENRPVETLIKSIEHAIQLRVLEAKDRGGTCDIMTYTDRLADTSDTCRWLIGRNEYVFPEEPSTPEHRGLMIECAQNLAGTVYDALEKDLYGLFKEVFIVNTYVSEYFRSTELTYPDITPQVARTGIKRLLYYHYRLATVVIQGNEREVGRSENAVALLMKAYEVVTDLIEEPYLHDEDD